MMDAFNDFSFKKTKLPECNTVMGSRGRFKPHKWQTLPSGNVVTCHHCHMTVEVGKDGKPGQIISGKKDE